MKIYKAKDEDRLDKVVFSHYGHLRFFEKVLETNSNLEAILKVGDEVKLPNFKDEPIIKENALWD
ncbi:tail protein X [Campylobacter portucalensis]